MHRLAAAVAALVLGTAALTACDAGKEATGPDPQDAADALAAALASGDFGDAAPAERTPEETAAAYADVVEGMGDVRPVVTAGEVDETDGTATAALAWTWPLAGDEWSYTTDARLTETGEEWQVAWSPKLVEPSLGSGTVLDATPV